MSNPEQFHGSGENSGESLAVAAGERLAELGRRSPETGAENAPERTAEAIESKRSDAEKLALSAEKPAHEADTGAPAAHHVRPVRNSKTLKAAYSDTLRHMRAELPAPSRAFSKVIHQPVVEKTSAIVGATVARPNAILFGALFAFLLSGGVYLVAKHYGYGLSGFEAIGSFIIGWIVGMAVDFVRLALRRR